MYHITGTFIIPASDYENPTFIDSMDGLVKFPNHSNITNFRILHSVFLDEYFPSGFGAIGLHT